MYKKLIYITVSILLSFGMIGCDLFGNNDTTTLVTTTESSTLLSTTLSLFEQWRASEDAIDLNGDRKIDEVDYDMFQLQNDYDYWKSSDAAIDLNSDRKIDEADFEMYKLQTDYYYWKNSDEAEDLNGDSRIDENDHSIYLFYDTWRYSDEAEDLNNDQVIDISDYEIYTEHIEFEGDYYITNYSYIGNEKYFVGDGYRFIDLGEYASHAVISVDILGNVSVTLTDSLTAELGDDYSVIEEGAQNMTIERISPFIVVIDSFVIINDVEYNLTLYLTEIDSGFSTTYTITGYYKEDLILSFDIIRIE